MQEFLAALQSKFLDSPPYVSVGGRVSYRKSTTSEYPRIVYSFISTNPDNVFARKGENTLMQFDIFATDSTQDSIDTIADTISSQLRTLLDDWRFTIAGVGTFEFTWANTLVLSEDVLLDDGSNGLVHIIVEYEVDYQA